jgi:hypothetical protein
LNKCASDYTDRSHFLTKIVAGQGESLFALVK